MTVAGFLAAAANMDAHDRIVLLVSLGVTRLPWIETILIEQHDYPADYVAALIDSMLANGTLVRWGVPFDLVSLRAS